MPCIFSLKYNGLCFIARCVCLESQIKLQIATEKISGEILGF